MIDKLSSLVGNKSAPLIESNEKPHAKRVLLTRLASMVPMALLIGFIILVWILFGDRLIPAREVTVETVVTLRSTTQTVSNRQPDQPAEANFQGQALFQASGWIEPDPLMIRATALYSGVVDAVYVLEGETVQKGQLLAKLIDDDAKLDLETARNTLARQEAALGSIEAEINIVRAEMTTLGKRIENAQARRAELQDEAGRMASIGIGGVPERDITQAQLKVDTQDTEIDALAVSQAEQEGRIVQLQSQMEEGRQQIASAKTEVARRALALSRTEIRSPVQGVVQHLMAAPGQKKVILMDHPESATIAHLYEPGKLQARIDVPLEEASKLSPGQPVRIRSPLLPDRIFKGQVTRIAGQADLQRNTLQAKVRFLETDPRLRPEMICRAEFLPWGDSGGVLHSTGDRNNTVDILVPLNALSKRTNHQATAWMLDASGKRIVKAEVELTDTVRDDYILIKSGLKPGDKVVTHPPDDLSEGDRVNPLPGATGNTRTGTSK